MILGTLASPSAQPATTPFTAASRADAPSGPAPVDVRESRNRDGDLPSASLWHRIGGLDLAHPTFLGTMGLANAGGAAAGAVCGAILGTPALGAAIGGVLGGGLLAAYGLYAGAVGARQVEHPPRYRPDTAPPVKSYPPDPHVKLGTHANSPADLGWAFSNISFSSHGTPLKGWYIPCDTPTSKTVVFVQGHGDDKRTFLARHCSYLHEKYNVVALDLRNQGESGGSTTTMGYYERDDVLAAVDYARTTLGTTDIGVMGLSMGGATVLEAAAVSPDVKAVISDSPYATVSGQVADAAKVRHYPLSRFVGWATSAKIGWDVGHPLRTHDPLRAVPQMKQPLLLIHGDADDYVLPRNSECLQNARPLDTERWLVHGARHVQSDLVAKDEYKRRIQEFFDKNL